MMPQMDTITGVLALVVGFGFIIFVHELGHFLVAKAVGIRCTQFAIGFGHAMLAWRKGMGLRLGGTESEYNQLVEHHLEAQGQSPEPSDDQAAGRKKRDQPRHTDAQIGRAARELGLGETEYRLNWVPLGGYVKMLGQEDLDPAARSGDPRAYNNKSVGARMAVISAGVVMNLIFGVIFFMIAFMGGVAFPPATVGAVSPNGPAAKTYAVGHDGEENYLGPKPGDQITHIDGKPTKDFVDIRMAAGLARKKRPIKLTIDREGEDEPLEYLITPEKGPDAMDNILWIGLAPPTSLEVGQPTRDDDLPDALVIAGVEPGMKVTAVDGVPVKHFHQFEQKIISRKGRPVDVTFTGAGPNAKVVKVTLAANPSLTKSNHSVFNLMGMVPAVKVVQPLPDSPVHRAGVQDGDVLVMLGEVSWPDFDRVVDIAEGSQGRPLALTVLRKQSDGTWQQTPLESVTPDDDGKLGYYRVLALTIARVARVLNDSPLATLRVPSGSTILAIDGQQVAGYADMQRILGDIAARGLENASESAKTGDPVKPQDIDAASGATNDTLPVATFTIRYRANILKNPPIEFARINLDRRTAKQLVNTGWSVPYDSVFKPLEIPVKADGPWHATKIGVQKTQIFLVQTYVTLTRLIQGSVPLKGLRGPIGIGHIGTRIVQERGFNYLLFFLGLISVNLVVINFLPIPVVDGGHMVFLLIEKLKGSPVGARVQTAATMVGLAMIGSIILITLYYDVARLMGR